MAIEPEHLIAETPTYSTPKATGYTQSQIEELAASIAGKLGFEPGGELKPVVERLGGNFKYLDTEAYFGEGGTARIVIDGPRNFVISLYKLGGLFDNRFAIAHELGHYFLHSEMGKRPITAGHAEGAVSREEWEASVFAAAFLMPRSQVHSLSARYTDYDLSAYFSVSIEAVEGWKKLISPSN